MSEQANSTGFDFNRPTIISLLYLGSFITGISGLVGIVLAHVWQGENEDDWAASHYTYLVRTFWIGLVGSIISIILMVVLIGVLMIIAVTIWFGVRSVLSLVRAQKREPMPQPETWLF